jgi:hydroxymethylbilane synthase
MLDASPKSAHGRYPIALALDGRRVLVVGAGPVAARKVEGLLAAGARVTIVAPELSDVMRALTAARHVEHIEREFVDRDVEGALLVFAATSDAAVNARVRDAARAAGTLVNDAADGVLGDFSLPAVHRAGALSIAVDTAAGAPAFARRVRDEIACAIDERYGRAATTLARMRAHALATLPPERRALVMARLASQEIDALAGLGSAEIAGEVERAAALVCATRGSALALVQAQSVVDVLARHGVRATIERITTLGDRAPERPIAALGADGVFVKELESALAERRADFAVHSCKDLPSTLTAGMRLAAIVQRADPRDAFCSERYEGFEALPPGAVVGTSSPRRVAQLRALRHDLRYEPIRGNVDTRLRKLRDGAFDAIVLAMAGLQRLGLRARYTVAFEPELLLPSPGQGALAVECCDADTTLAATLQGALGDDQSERCIAAERALLRGLRAGCQTPVGALATLEGDELTLDGLVAALDGSHVVRLRRKAHAHTLDDAERVGDALALELLAAGAETLLRPSRGEAATP